MITYTEILKVIKNYNGGIVTFICDDHPVNDDLLLSIKQDLEKEYKKEIQSEEIFNEKTFNIINFNDKIDFKKNFGNDNVLTIVLRKYSETSNTMLVHNSEYQSITGKLLNASALTILLRNQNLILLKSRHSDFPKGRINVNINTLTRKIKLQNLNQKNN